MAQAPGIGTCAFKATKVAATQTALVIPSPVFHNSRPMDVLWIILSFLGCVGWIMGAIAVIAILLDRDMRKERERKEP